MISTSVINVFQLSFEARLKSWHDLRKSLANADTKTKCVEIDKWWQSAPLVNHYLHPAETSSWPGPWDLLSDNEYCHIARGLGMVYTLLLTGVDDIDFCIATDDNSEEVIIVLVDHAKYVLNYWPNSVLNMNQLEFSTVKPLDLDQVKTKL
jgi:hypothetical protein